MLAASSELPPSTRAYLASVIAAGILALGQSVVALVREPLGTDWLLLVALTLIAGSFSIRIPGINARFSVSEAFVLAALVAFGTNAATVIVALDALTLTSWIRRPTRSRVRALFNMAAGAVAIFVAGQVLALMLPTLPPQNASLDLLLIPVLTVALLYFAVNSALIALAIGMERRESPVSIWRHNFAWLSLNYLGGGSVAILLVTYGRTFNIAAVSVIAPFLLITYFTYRFSTGRLEDANRHVKQLNDLYMSTIETLAMAVDAKDQITHGHIRRVQVFATQLAKRIGVSDDRELKAIETAALLHDMGKLAIPEHILNKPGRLTVSEFNRMKQHADLGADLLSSIRFPYPVVPIVRHHHENWDGSGYPAGISGTDIPLGARILSVVDCFDALTSDRPYRPRLSNDDAFTILRERRGTMYDPMVVDLFVRVFPEISPAAIRAGQEARSILVATVDGSPAALEPLEQIRAAASEVTLLNDCREHIGRAGSTRDAFEAAVECVRQLTPANVIALYRYRPDGDVVTAEIVAGDPSGLLTGFNIKLGQRVTGWCGANRTTAVNSVASLDLAQIANQFVPPLRSVMSVPLFAGDVLLGVLTGYSAKEEAFSPEHVYLWEQVAAALTRRLAETPGSVARAEVTRFSRDKNR